jgi:hypothetical protein
MRTRVSVKGNRLRRGEAQMGDCIWDPTKDTNRYKQRREEAEDWGMA